MGDLHETAVKTCVQIYRGNFMSSLMLMAPESGHDRRELTLLQLRETLEEPDYEPMSDLTRELLVINNNEC